MSKNTIQEWLAYLVLSCLFVLAVAVIAGSMVIGVELLR